MSKSKPVVGMLVALRRSPGESLADIPARVVSVWPPFRSGERLVTLEFAQPVRDNKVLIHRIDVFASEVYQPIRSRHA